MLSQSNGVIADGEKNENRKPSMMQSKVVCSYKQVPVEMIEVPIYASAEPICPIGLPSLKRKKERKKSLIDVVLGIKRNSFFFKKKRNKYAKKQDFGGTSMH